jgi:hypothetical protein
MRTGTHLLATTLASFLCVASHARSGLGQVDHSPTVITDFDLNRLAEGGDATALSELRHRAEKGDRDAKSWLVYILLNGTANVKPNFDEAARWENCPKPDDDVQEGCKSVTYKSLPHDAARLLRRMNCHVGPNYDSGSMIQLSSGKDSEYQMCCHDAPHGPCDAVVIGRIGGKWKDLTADTGVDGFDAPCGGFFVLDTKHNGFHDVCIPYACSTAIPDNNGRKCLPTIWQL